MSVLKQLPFVKLLIPFIAGISLVISLPQLGRYAFIPMLLFLVLFLIFAIKRTGILTNRLAGLSVCGLLFSFGGWLSYNADPHNHSENLKKAGLEGNYLIRVSEIPQVKAKTIKIQAKVIARIDSNQKLIRADEYVLFYFDKKLKMPKTGDELLVKCSFNPIPDPENPYQFNYKRFLKWQGIYYQSFIKQQKNVLNTGKNSASFFQNLAYTGSEYLKKLFKENIRDSTALGVTEALIFGYKEDLPKDLVESYSRTGTLHVLAVSGLHVAIVFLMLARFLWFLNKWRYGVVLKTCVVIISIWAYCILTGLAPSIIRAGFMISFVLIGKALNRHANVFNIIAATAFIILCINPFWLMNVGFQLSFAAVLGIVYLQQFLLPLWVPPNWFFRQVWNIIIISMCAQIATFPLSLYYFNQFPNYFLLSNLFIIPLTSAVIYTGIGMVVFSKIPVVLSLFSWLTEHLVKLTNYLVVSIEKLPYSFIDGVKIEMSQLVLLYICVMCVIFWLVFTNKKAFVYALLSMTVILGIMCYDKIIKQKEHGIVIFNIPNQNALLASDGNQSVLFSDSINSGRTMFYIRGWLINKRVWPVYKEYDLKTIEKQKIELPEMDLRLKRGVLFFKGTKLNLISDNIGKIGAERTYILPTFFNWRTKYADNMTDTIYIGLCKSKRLQKKVKIFLSKYHNCVICDTKYKYLQY